MLGENLLASLLERWHIKAIRERKQLIYVFRLNTHSIRVDVSQEHHEEIIRHVIVGSDSLLLFSEIVGERRLEVSRARCKNDLMAVDGLAFHHKCYITKLWLVQDGQEVALVDICGLQSCTHHAARLLAQQACCARRYSSLLRWMDTAHRVLMRYTHHLRRVDASCAC